MIMNTQEIKIDFPADILLTLNETENELKQNIKISLAIRLYSLQKLTIGKAAQISGLSRYEFENVLAEHNVSISNLSVEDVLNDSQKLK
jgi:predicted HTH domain antitoxin